MERVPSRSFSSMDLNAMFPASAQAMAAQAMQAQAFGGANASTPSLASVAASATGPAPGGGNGAAGNSGVNKSSFGALQPPVGGPSGRSFPSSAAAPQSQGPPPGADSRDNRANSAAVPAVSFAVKPHGQAAATPAVPPMGKSPTAGSAAIPGQFPGDPNRSMQHRSPSRTRGGINPGNVAPNAYSPFAMRNKSDGSMMQAMFSPQVPGPPPVFALNRCNTSMTSSNASFYFTPQHAMAGPGGGGGGGPPNGSQAPVPAANYCADSADPIDMMLAVGLSSLDRKMSAKLVLRRIGSGKYEIDGRRVSLRWTDQGGNPGLLVCEDDVIDAKGSEMPLLAYLSQAANVACALSGQRADQPKIARVPKEQRLTFAESKDRESASTLDIEKMGNERCESMRLACEQAKLREQAAEAYDYATSHKHPYGLPPRTLPPPAGLPLPYLN